MNLVTVRISLAKTCPRGEREGNPLVWGVSDEEIGVGGVGQP